MIALNRIRLLCSFLQIDETALKKKCRSIIEHDTGKYCSVGTLGNMFKDVELKGKEKNTPLSSRTKVKEKIADLFYAASSDIAMEKGLTIDPGFRLDAPLSEFCKSLKLKFSDVEKFLSADSIDLVSFFSEYAFKKDDFLNPDQVISNLDIPEIFGLRRYFSVYRLVGNYAARKKLVEEKIEFNNEFKPKIKYIDRFGNIYTGIAFFSDEKIISLAFLQGSKSRNLEAVYIVIMLEELLDGEFLMLLNRVGSSNSIHGYRCIAYERSEDFRVATQIGSKDAKLVRYCLVVDNKNDQVDENSSFLYRVSESRKKLIEGEQLHNTYLKHFEEFHSASTLDEVLDKISEILN